MNIIKRELRSSVISIVVWSLAFFFMAYASIIKFDSILSTGPEVMALLDHMPRIVLALFNMVDLDLTSLPGYFAVVANILLIMASTHGLFLGIRLFAKEEQEKTADFLLTKPRSRNYIYLSKIMAGVLIVLILQLVLFLCNWNALGSHLPDAWHLLIHYTAVFAVIHLLFLSLGILLINVLPRGKAESVGLIILLANYLIPVIADMSDTLYVIKEFFPFNMFLHEEMANAGGLQLFKLMILILALIGFLVLGQRKFEKKDIYV